MNLEHHSKPSRRSLVNFLFLSGVKLVSSAAIFWGGALHDIQKTSAKETKYLIMYLKNALDGEDVILS